jgi:dihydroorotase
LVYGRLVEGGLIDLPTMVERMSLAPARVFNLPGGTLKVGSPADVTIFDPNGEWTVDPGTFLSKSRNTPFTGWKLKGKPSYTIVGGEVVWEGR